MIDLYEMSKEHEQLFPKADLLSQVWKLEEEITEYSNVYDDEEALKETADIIIVCAGLYRWCPYLALSVKDFYNTGFPEKLIEAEVRRKWKINLNRKWEWNGKTYHHVEE